MTAAAEGAAQEGAALTGIFEGAARALAEAQRGVERAPRLVARWFDSPSLARPLERAQKFLVESSSADAPLLKAGEWYLDNYHLIRRVARQRSC